MTLQGTPLIYLAYLSTDRGRVRLQDISRGRTNLAVKPYTRGICRLFRSGTPTLGVARPPDPTCGMTSTSSHDFPPVRACIFDVDGLLINSEDIYTEAYNNILHSYGKLDLPWSVKARQQSRGREVSKLYSRNHLHPS